jgi:hypothetical protein
LTVEADGGHLLALEVGRGSIELHVTMLRDRLERTTDASIGANVLQLEPASGWLSFLTTR